MKVHCLSYSSFFAAHALCGISDLNAHGDIDAAPRSVWPWIPLRARCLRCDRLTTDSAALACLVTPEIELTIEAALHNIAAHFATWPDKWHVDPHGTGNNPHVWFDGETVWQHQMRTPDKGCPCGIVAVQRFEKERRIEIINKALRGGDLVVSPLGET